MTFTFSTIDLDKILNDEIQVKIYADKEDVSTEWKDIIEDTIPRGYEGILLSMAFNNDISADIELRVNGKTKGEYGFPVNTAGFPDGMQDVLIMAKIPERATFALRARNIGGSATLKYRIILLLVKR